MKKRKERNFIIRKWLLRLFSAIVVVGVVSIVGIVGGVECETLSLERAVVQSVVSSILIGAGACGRYAVE